MKKYTTLTTNTSTLVSEIMTYLNSVTDVEDTEHFVHSFHIVDNTTMAGTSIGTIFSGLTVSLAAHVTVNGDAMFNHCYDGPFILIPLADCGSTVVKIFDVAPGATRQQPELYYIDSVCTLTNTVPLTAPVVIGPQVTFTIESSDLTKLSDVLMVWFNEDITSYLA